MASALPIPVTILGGYLGVGKTTLVNHLLRHADGVRIAVLVNEFGALPIDGDLIDGIEGGVIAIAGGCICCSYGDDLIAALQSLSSRSPAPDHIVVEASGVALPGAIARALTLFAGLTCDATIVVADAETIEQRAADRYMGDTIMRQLGDADLIVLNKIDLVDGSAHVAVRQWLERAAPGRRVIEASQGRVPNDAVLGIRLAQSREGLDLGGRHRTGALETQSFIFEHAVDAVLLAAGLRDPSLQLVRAKGIVFDPQDRWHVLQVVGHRSDLTPAAGADGPARLVVITHGTRVPRERIAAMIAACALRMPSSGGPD